LILELRDSLGATVVIVTHELASIFAIGTNSVFLDADSKNMIARATKVLLAESKDLRCGSSHTGRGASMSRQASPAVMAALWSAPSC